MFLWGDLNATFQHWISTESNFWSLSVSNITLRHWNENVPLICFEEGASVNTRHVAYDPELVFVVRVKFDNDGNDSMHIFSGWVSPPPPCPSSPCLSLLYNLFLFPSHSLLWRICDKQWGNCIQMAGGTTGPVELSKQWAIRPPLGPNWGAAKYCWTRRARRHTLQSVSPLTAWRETLNQWL